MSSSPLRSIPSVEKVLQSLVLAPGALPRPAVVAIVRRELSTLRRDGKTPEFASIIASIQEALHRHERSRLQPVINGTGVLIHTNLGRSPMSENAVQTVTQLASRYNNLEYDLESGTRGARASYLEHHLALLCHAEAATVVNNCAAALILILRHFTASKPEVIISRGELIQIGGGFRIPDILETSGARLREIGTTNKTSLEDYAAAITPQTGLILKVHRSNFFMRGFVDSPATEEIAELARRKKIPLVEDLGSGAVTATEKLGPLPHEPMPGEVLKLGVDVVCFSGDKLMGGPQAGVIAGGSRHVARLKKEPFFRALRCDKLILGALQATVDDYLSAEQRGSNGRSTLPIPVLNMVSQPEDILWQRAETLKAKLSTFPAHCQVGPALSHIGGGTLPEAKLPSVVLSIKPHAMEPSELAARLRMTSPPLIGYLSGGAFRIDLRTVFPQQDVEVIQCLRDALRRSFAPAHVKSDSNHEISS